LLKKLIGFKALSDLSDINKNSIHFQN
jgi:hypothetical protein